MSPRARVIAVVSAVSVAAAGAAVGGALLQGGTAGGEAHGETVTTNEGTREPPALELALTDRDDREARALRAAERLYETGRPDDARRRFVQILERNPRSVEAAVGAAITGWPDGTIEQLEALAEQNPRSAVARLNLGLALLASGDVEAARSAWSDAKEADADSPAALRADDLLHPDMPPGRPRFVLPAPLPRELRALPVERRLAALERRAQAGGAREWLVYGASLEQAGRRVSAQRAYDRAAALAPDDPLVRTAAAVVRFDKDDPAPAFSRLGPLASEYPGSSAVRFHLGLMLLWLPELDEARVQLRRAADAEPGSFYAREARRILAELPDSE